MGRAKEPLKAGDQIGNDHSKNIEYLMRPALPIAADNPLPFHMANGNTLSRDIPAGAFITASAIHPKDNDPLWTLRKEQDAHFLE